MEKLRNPGTLIQNVSTLPLLPELFYSGIEVKIHSKKSRRQSRTESECWMQCQKAWV